MGGQSHPGIILNYYRVLASLVMVQAKAIKRVSQHDQRLGVVFQG